MLVECADFRYTKCQIWVSLKPGSNGEHPLFMIVNNSALWETYIAGLFDLEWNLNFTDGEATFFLDSNLPVTIPS